MADPWDIPESFIETAEELADIARRISLGYFRGELDINSKDDRSPVTIADREAERRMRDVLDARFPDHAIFGEEFGIKKAESAWTWILDPIDGTKSFVCGKPTFGSLICLVHDRTPVIGVVEIPTQSERWLGVHGRPTLFNGAPCRASGISSLDGSRMMTTTPDMFTDAEWQLFDRISRRAPVRCFGADCYAYGLLASGHVEVVMEADLKAYDYMALVPVIEGAGGAIGDWHGNRLEADSAGRVLACANPALYREMVDVIGRETASS